MLTGEYAKRASQTHKTKEGRELLAAVRATIVAVDDAMKAPSTFNRGQRIAQIMSGLELAADRYDLFGEKPRKQKSKLRQEESTP